MDVMSIYMTAFVIHTESIGNSQQHTHNTMPVMVQTLKLTCVVFEVSVTIFHVVVEFPHIHRPVGVRVGALA